MSQLHSGETIAAIATASGSAAVGLLRISGPDALRIAVAMTNGKAEKAIPRTAMLCLVFEADGSLIDETLLTYFSAPRSYTGEMTCEFAGHGGVLVMRRLLQRALACGARSAEPGEFTRQAFLNGKLDLTQAEAIMDLISARTDQALHAAHQQRQGHLGRKTEALRDEILETLAHIEAYIDFPDEDISPDVGNALVKRLQSAASDLHSMLATAGRGRILREGIRTVISGAPNTGKSSLLNRLLGFDRAIVSDIAGTTRDTLEESANVGGVLLRLIDTAGIRDHTSDPIEAEGMRRSSAEREQADLVLSVYDATLPAPEILAAAASMQERIILANKADLGAHPSWHEQRAVMLSCSSGEGFGELEARIRDIAQLQEFDAGASMIAINARHQHCLERAREALGAAIALLEAQADLTLTSIELREAMEALGEIAGKLDTEDLLGVIFSRFCIGK
jgi:tRNA modification GTPase